jgi:hypothetical protein
MSQINDSLSDSASVNSDISSINITSTSFSNLNSTHLNSLNNENPIEVLNKNIGLNEDNKEYQKSKSDDENTSTTSVKGTSNVFLNKKRNPVDLIEELLKENPPSLKENKIDKNVKEYINNKHDDDIIKEYKSLYGNSGSRDGCKVVITSSINMKELYDWKVFEKLKISKTVFII